MTEAIEEWIEREFSGYGVAVRRKDESPIPGEPFMSMAEAKELLRRALRTFAAPPQKMREALESARDYISSANFYAAGTPAYIKCCDQLIKIDAALSAQPQRLDALRLLAELFSESLHQTWTRGEIVNVIEDAIRLSHARPERGGAA